MTDAPASPRIKITYATLRNDNEELHRQFEAGLEQARGLLGGTYRNFVGGQERDGEGTFEKRSPIDGALIGHFAKGTRIDVQEAIAAARTAFPAWSRRSWEDRIDLLRRAADLISERQMMIAAIVAMEVGKKRLEPSATSRRRRPHRWSCDMVEQ